MTLITFRAETATYDRAMMATLPELKTDARTFRRALDGGEFVPHFQPIVALATGKIRGFEVLARWQHPRVGLISPDTFIPVAEREGWITEVTRQILQGAFAAVANYALDLHLAFNISPRQLKDLSLPAQIRELAENAGFPPEHATIEITESALADDIASARRIAEDLKAIGCRIALDDFGTGYSCLYHLKSLPFDELKVDRSFVSSMATERESRKIVAAVVGLGQSLGLTTVAEGIETREQRDLLLRLGCDMGQGWLFGRPETADVLPAIIERRPQAPTIRNACGNEPSVACREGLPSQRLAQLEAVYDGAPVGLSFVDRSLKYININRRLAEMHGCSIEDHCGKTVREMIPSLYRLIEPHIHRALNGESIANVEIRESNTSPGNPGRVFLASYQPAFDEAGEVIGVSCAVLDFTSRKAAEDRLRQYERVVEGLDEMVAVVDCSYRYILTNRAFIDAFAPSEQSIAGRLISEFVDRKVFLQIVVPRLKECFAGRHVLFGMEYSLPRIGRRALTVSCSPIEVSGSVEAVACVLRDVTDMKRIETVETGWQKRIELAAGAGLRIGLWDWDIRENTVVWSDESYRQWGFTRDTFSGKVAEAVPRIHPDDRPRVEAAIHRVISRETDEYSSQYRVQRPDGSVCWIDARGVIAHPSSSRMIGIGVDITDYKRRHTQSSTESPSSATATSSCPPTAAVSGRAEACW